jgi:HSP20 family protein
MKRDFKFYWENEKPPRVDSLNFDVPGFKKDEISASLKDGTLFIRAKTSKNRIKRDANSYHEESISSSFMKSFILPKGFDRSDFSLDIEDGVVKLKRVKKKRIKK